MTTNQKIAEKLLEVLMNSQSHNPAWALQEVLQELRNQLTLPRGASVLWYDVGRDDCLKQIDEICSELELL